MALCSFRTQDTYKVLSNQKLNSKEKKKGAKCAISNNKMYCNIYLNQCYFCLSAFQVRRDQVEFVDESETKERVITLIFHLRVEKGNFQHVEYEYCYLSIKTCLISICLTQSNRNSILKLSPCNCPLFHKEARRIILFSLIIEDLLLCFYLFILVLKTKLEKII